MKKPSRIIVAVLLILVVIVIIVQSKKTQQVPQKIGVIAPLSGFVASYGEEMKKGILEVASSTPGVEFVFEDDKCEPKDAVSAYQKLVQFEKVRVIIGPGCGSPQEAIIPLIKADNTIVLVPSAASRDLYTLSNDNFFNVQYSLENESAFNAEKLTEAGFKKVALIRYQNAFSEAHAKAFKEAFKGEILEHVLKDETSDVAAEVAKIKPEKVDAVYAPDVSFFFGNGLTKLRQYGITVPVYSTYVAELPAVRTMVPDVIYSFPGDLSGTQGAVYELSKQAAEIAVEALKSCADSSLCVKNSLISSNKFDEFGVYKRPMILKQIKGGEAVKLTQ
ncbi:MAG: ABC transporter substrate-binding protein [Patescibacteria group bacterium]